MDRPIALIGFGEAAQAFAAGVGWTATGFDVAGRDADFAATTVRQCPTSAAAVAGAGVVLSLVTAGACLEAAAAAAQHLSPGALWFDMNSVAPATKRRAAATIAAGGGRYVDAAIMAPVVPRARAVPIVLAGPDAADGAAALAAAGFGNVRLVAGAIGAAAAIKMVRSVMIKGVEALTAECLLAARRAGAMDEVLASLGPDAALRADYALDRMLAHGGRRAEELDEVAATLEDLGIVPLLTRATAVRQRAAGGVGAGRPVPAGLDAKLALLDPAALEAAA